MYWKLIEQLRTETAWILLAGLATLLTAGKNVSVCVDKIAFVEQSLTDFTSSRLKVRLMFKENAYLICMQLNSERQTEVCSKTIMTP